MKAHTLAREEIEGWRVNIDQLMGGSEEDTIQINVLCDMALECLETRIRAFATPRGDTRLIDALRGMVGLVQLVQHRYPDFPVDNHRIIEAMSVLNSYEPQREKP